MNCEKCNMTNVENELLRNDVSLLNVKIIGLEEKVTFLESKLEPYLAQIKAEEEQLK